MLCMLCALTHGNMVVITGRQTSGPTAAFLRPLAPSQPKEEAKAQAASLAATAAAAARQQGITVDAAIQVCLMPEAGMAEGRALPAQEKPVLKCPAEMQAQQLQQVQAHSTFILPFTPAFDCACEPAVMLFRGGEQCCCCCVTVGSFTLLCLIQC